MADYAAALTAHVGQLQAQVEILQKQKQIAQLQVQLAALQQTQAATQAALQQPPSQTMMMPSPSQMVALQQALPCPDMARLEAWGQPLLSAHEFANPWGSFGLPRPQRQPLPQFLSSPSDLQAPSPSMYLSPEWHAGSSSSSVNSNRDPMMESFQQAPGSSTFRGRGFIPSLGPSPAFQPQPSVQMGDMSTMTPLCMSVDAVDEIDSFTLPTPMLAEESVTSVKAFSTSRCTKKEEATAEKKTTMMLKNIDSKYTIEQLIRDLQSDAELSGVHDYDYIYLPADFQRHRNLSYAFINFTSEEKAVEFAEKVELARQGSRRKMCTTHGTRKTLEVVPANLQGRDANILAHLRAQSKSRAGVMNKWFRPTVLLPDEGQQYLKVGDNNTTVQLATLWGSVSAVMRIVCEADLETPLALEADTLPQACNFKEPLDGSGSSERRKRRGKRGGQRAHQTAEPPFWRPNQCLQNFAEGTAASSSTAAATSTAPDPHWALSITSSVSAFLEDGILSDQD